MRFGFGHIHPGVLGAPLVEARVAETIFMTQVLHWHARLNLTQKPDDLLFCVFALSHVRHSPKLTDPSEISLARYTGSTSLGEASARSTRGDHSGVTRFSSLQARHARAPIRR